MSLSFVTSAECTARAAIEEDYAKRLTKLSKMILGRDEIGYVSLLLGLKCPGAAP